MTQTGTVAVFDAGFLPPPRARRSGPRRMVRPLSQVVSIRDAGPLVRAAAEVEPGCYGAAGRLLRPTVRSGDLFEALA